MLLKRCGQGNCNTSLYSLQVTISCGHPDVFWLAGHLTDNRLLVGLQDGWEIRSRMHRWSNKGHQSSLTEAKDTRGGGEGDVYLLISPPVVSIALQDFALSNSVCAPEDPVPYKPNSVFRSRPPRNVFKGVGRASSS